MLWLVAILLGPALVACGGDEVADGPGGPAAPPPPPPPVYCRYCGIELPAGSELDYRPVMVMIDNLSPARPQAGLTEACVVFELLAEGGITRLAPVYGHGAPDKVGPVRSARHYFLDLALGLDALYTHVGKSPQAGVDIGRLGVANLDAFGLDDHFWRESTRPAPHNLYTGLASLRDAAEAKGYATRREATAGDRWPYTAGRPDPERGEAGDGFTLTWPYSRGGHQVSFVWEPGADGVPGDYLRFEGDNPHLAEETGEQLRARSVVVAFAEFRRVPGDAEGRLDAQLTGEGEAVVFANGRSYAAGWLKAERSSPLVLLDADGEKLALDVGQTWILIAPHGAELRRHEPGGNG